MALKRWWFPVLIVWMVLTPYTESKGEIYRYVDPEGVVHYSDVRQHKNYVKTRISRQVADHSGPDLETSPPPSAPSLPETARPVAPSPPGSAGADGLESESSSGLAGGALPLPANYSHYIEEISRKYGLRPDLIWAVIKAESNFNPLAVSPKGAQGLMQLMPATARSHGVDNPFDPYQNIEGGVRYLRNLLYHYKGDLTLTLAAYNAGKEKVQQHRGVPPYPETRDYIQRVMRYLKGSGLLTVDMQGIKGAIAKAEEKIYRYTNPNGVTLFTDIPR